MSAIATTEAPKPLTREQIIEMLQQLGGVGSVEIKMTVPPSQRAAVAELGVDFLGGKLREVVFFDTPDLQLFRSGVAVRARRTQDKDDDTVVKLRPVVPRELPPEVLTSPNLKVEMDVTRGSFVVSASLKGVRPPGEVREVLAGRKPLEKLFSKEQRAFFNAHRPEGVNWNDLVSLGPSLITVLKCTPPEFGRKLVIEQWHYPGEVPLVELSAKAPPDGVLRLAGDAVAYLRERGLSASGPQEPKTRRALEFYARKYAVPQPNGAG